MKHFSSHFPVKDRVTQYLTSCVNTQPDKITQLKDSETYTTFEEEFPQLVQRNLSLRLTVKESGPLSLDPNVTHPFVKAHFVDLNTCKYIEKSIPASPGMSNRETAQLLTAEGLTRLPVDYLQPLATNFFDMRIKGQTNCEWNESFIVNEHVGNLLRPRTLILFEILECSAHLISQKSKLLNKDKLYPVAWGFLRPLGQANVHLGRNRIQLYRYKMAQTSNASLDFRTPEVLLEFNWPTWEKYNTFLEVELSFSNRSAGTIERMHYSRAPWEKEVSLMKYSDVDHVGVKLQQQEQVLSHEQDMKLKSWERFKETPSILPNKLQWKFESERQGCLRLDFS